MGSQVLDIANLSSDDFAKLLREVSNADLLTELRRRLGAHPDQLQPKRHKMEASTQTAELAQSSSTVLLNDSDMEPLGFRDWFTEKRKDLAVAYCKAHELGTSEQCVLEAAINLYQELPEERKTRYIRR